MSDFFKYSQYEKFLDELKKKGKISLFKNWNKKKKVFLLRHDIDLDISLAHKLALIENKKGICSTYFVLITSPAYNIFAKKNQILLRAIIKMGHEIGIHFDPSIYKNRNLNFSLKKEIKIVEYVINQKVKSISIHEPSIIKKFPNFKNLINAYDLEFKKNSFEYYISDSCMNFSNKNIYQFMDKIKYSSCQILLHPMHYTKNGDDYRLICSDKIKRMIKEVEFIFSNNLTYKKVVGNNLLKIVKKK